MKSYVSELLIVIFVAACSSSGGGEPATDANTSSDGSPPGDAPAADAATVDAPSARNAKAVGQWTTTIGAGNCGGFAQGFVGTALPSADQFNLQFKEMLPNGTQFETICTFTSDTAFTCTNVGMSANLGGCIVQGGITGMNGTITGTSFSMSGSASNSRSAQCPGGAGSCGPSSSTGAGTIAP